VIDDCVLNFFSMVRGFIVLLLAISCWRCDGFSVAGYLPEWRHRLLDEDHEDRLQRICSTLTHMIFFSLQVDSTGNIAALDRWPSEDRMQRVRSVCQGSLGTKVLVCFGGNSRSDGFSAVVASPEKRQSFLGHLKDFLAKHQLDGIDWNWEYPNSKEDWEGLSLLINEMRISMPSMVQTMAYYPDGRQENIISHFQLDKSLNLIHMMAYDQPHQHSTFEFAKKSIASALENGFGNKATLGLPFYARHVKTGDWKTYEDVLKSGPLKEHADSIGEYYFNGPRTIQRKTVLAIENHLAGVMIWESGQDSPDGDLHLAIQAGIQNQEKKEL